MSYQTCVHNTIWEARISSRVCLGREHRAGGCDAKAQWADGEAVMRGREASKGVGGGDVGPPEGRVQLPSE